MKQHLNSLKRLMGLKLHRSCAIKASRWNQRQAPKCSVISLTTCECIHTIPLELKRNVFSKMAAFDPFSPFEPYFNHWSRDKAAFIWTLAKYFFFMKYCCYLNLMEVSVVSIIFNGIPTVLINVVSLFEQIDICLYRDELAYGFQKSY